MTSTPQSQARSLLRYITRRWGTRRISDLPIYDRRERALVSAADYHYCGGETELFMQPYICVDTRHMVASLAVRWSLDGDVEHGVYQSAESDDSPLCTYGDVDLAHTARIARPHRMRVARAIREALVLEGERPDLSWEPSRIWVMA